MKQRTIKDLTEQELLTLIEKSFSANHIEVSGIIVSSQKCNLQECEETINRLIDKHKDFLLMKKQTQLKTGYCG